MVTGIDPELTGVEIRFMLDGNEQTLTFSLDDWQIIVEHGVHQSPRVLMFLMISLARGQIPLQALSDELSYWLDRDDLQRQEGGSDDNLETTKTAIAGILDEFDALPPEQITLHGGLHVLYERYLQQQTGWEPDAEGRQQFDSQSAYIRTLRDVVTLLYQWQQVVTELAEISDEDSGQQPSESMNGLSLAEVQTLIKQQFIADQISLFFKQHQPDTEKPSESVPGMLMLPVPVPGADGDKNAPQGAHAPEQQESEGQDSGFDTAGEAAGSSDFGNSAGKKTPPPPRGMPRPTPAIRINVLSATMNQVIDANCPDPEIEEHEDTVSRANFILSTLSGQAKADLIDFLSWISAGPIDSANPLASIIENGLMKKGLIVMIFWAQGMTVNDPLMQMIAGADLIYRGLREKGVLEIWPLLKDRSYPDAVRDVIQITAEAHQHLSLSSTLREAVFLTAPVQVHYVYQLLSSEPVISRQIVGSLRRLTGRELPENFLTVDRLPSEPTLAPTELPEPPDDVLRELGMEHLSLNDPEHEEIPFHPDADWFRTATEQMLIPVIQKLLEASKNFFGVKIERLIGRGGNGIVLEVSHQGNIFALKYIPFRNPEQQRSLAAAADRITELLSDRRGFKSVILSHEYSEQHQSYIQLMTRVDETLEQYLDRHGKMKDRDFIRKFYLPILGQIVCCTNDACFTGTLNLKTLA